MNKNKWNKKKNNKNKYKPIKENLNLWDKTNYIKAKVSVLSNLK